MDSQKDNGTHTHINDGQHHVNGNSYSYHQYLTCTKGTGITGYNLGCGKTETTIDSYTINY